MAAPTLIRHEQIDPFERHFTPKELAELWQLDESTVRRMFQDEAGVLKIGQVGRRNKRGLRDTAHSGIHGRAVP